MLFAVISAVFVVFSTGMVLTDFKNGGICCYEINESGECFNYNGANDWCSESKSNCESTCLGDWLSFDAEENEDEKLLSQPPLQVNQRVVTSTSNNEGEATTTTTSGSTNNAEIEFTSASSSSSKKTSSSSSSYNTPENSKTYNTGSTSNDWTASDMSLTHYWDCNGQACDATVLSPWDQSKYRSSPGYAPVDPNSFGGSVYGEKLWLTGAANDALSSYLGAADGCCGDSAEGGCGKCLLIQNPDAVNGDWTAVVMKKTRCPPYSAFCGNSNRHFDIAAPGFDNLASSGSNICGSSGTGFSSQQQSAVVGSWWTRYSNTAQAASLCDNIGNSKLKQGCRLFAQWGWTTGTPNSVKFKPVTCPPAFIQHISSQFNSNGVV